MHLKENNAYIPEVRDDARGILDVNLEAADMSQHVSFYKRFLVESAFLNVQSILRESATITRREQPESTTAAASAKSTPDTPDVDTPLGIYEHFLERYTQHTCRPIERRMRCIQARDNLRQADVANFARSCMIALPRSCMIAFGKMNLVAGVAYCMSMVGTACGSPCDPTSVLTARFGPKVQHT